jgi:hypothetical protein
MWSVFFFRFIMSAPETRDVLRFYTDPQTGKRAVARHQCACIIDNGVVPIANQAYPICQCHVEQPLSPGEKKTQ